jgi:hypothetical protein
VGLQQGQVEHVAADDGLFFVSVTSSASLTDLLSVFASLRRAPLFSFSSLGRGSRESISPRSKRQSCWKRDADVLDSFCVSHVWRAPCEMKSRFLCRNRARACRATPMATSVVFVVVLACIGARAGRVVYREPAPPGPTRPVDCLVAWGPWSMCRGKELQWRTATVQVKPQNGGRLCGDVLERRVCGATEALGFAGCAHGCERCDGNSALDACVSCKEGHGLEHGFCLAL